MAGSDAVLQEYFTVDGLLYELNISRKHVICLGVVGGASPTYRPTYDPFDWDYQPFVTDDIGSIRYPVRVFRVVIRRLYNWIGGQRPPYFSFGALTSRRRRTYQRIAEKIVNRFPYTTVEQNGAFYFYRLKSG